MRQQLPVLVANYQARRLEKPPEKKILNFNHRENLIIFNSIVIIISLNSHRLYTSFIFSPF